MTAGTRPVRHKLPLVHRLAWILIIVETTSAASIVYPALQAETSNLTDNKEATTRTISDDATTTPSPATTVSSTTRSPSDPVTEVAGGAVTTTKKMAKESSFEMTTKNTTKRPAVLTTTTARPVNQVATVQSTTKLPSTKVTTTRSTTGRPTVQMTESVSGEVTKKITTQSPSTPVTKAESAAVTTTKSSTALPVIQTTTNNPTKRPEVLSTTTKSTTERPVVQVTTLRSTTARPVTQVTTVQTTTKLPSTQLTTIRSTTGRPSAQVTKTPVSEASTTTTTTQSPSVTETDAVTSQVTTAHTSTARPSVQLTTMKSTAQLASTQATRKKSTSDHTSAPVTKTISGGFSTTKVTTEQPSTQETTTKSTTERPSVQVATTTSTTKSPSVSVTEAVGGNVTTAKSTTERPSTPVTKPASSEATTVGSTTELPSVQVTAAVDGGLTTTTSTTQRPSTHITKATTSTTTTEGGMIVDVILVTSPKPTASTTPPPHNLGDIVQEAVVVPQGSPVVEGGDKVVIEVVPILNGNATSGQGTVGSDTHSTFKPSLETTKKPKKRHSGLKKQFTNSYMRTYVTKRCGVPNERMRRIVGGKVTTLERYPWTVGVWMRYGQRPYCGGVIISWLFVLTAGHCTRNKVAHDLRVSFGLSEIDPDRVQSEQQEHLIAVAAIHQNPLFKDIVHGDDISILKMSKPLQSGGYPVTPICIPEATETHITTKDIVGTEGVVAGWGRTKYGGESSKQLREVWLPIVSNNACSEIFKDILKIRDEMICAGDINGTKDACQGDSGGSLMWRSKADDRWYTLGVVSFGVKCAEPGYYGTYTRVQSYLDWICQVTDGLLCFGSSAYKAMTLPSKDMREKHLRERRSRN
uniref:limulus clotting factor C n=1 Tax=Rhipicephalus zambeziensis TaxID=60191 RepID=A0A224YRX6_9ACAR